MACFAGRNSRFNDPAVPLEDWRVADEGEFMRATIEGLFDHGRQENIVAVHLLKTTLAVRDELAVPVVPVALVPRCRQPVTVTDRDELCELRVCVVDVCDEGGF